MHPTVGERFAGWWAVPGVAAMLLWFATVATGGFSVTGWSVVSGDDGRWTLAVSEGWVRYQETNHQKMWHHSFADRRSLRWSWWDSSMFQGPNSLDNAVVPHRGWRHPRGWLARCGIAYWSMPIPPGLVGMTGIDQRYIGVSLPLLVLVFAGPWAVYRVRRWRRTLLAAGGSTLCPDCGYDVRGLERGCPECGWSRAAAGRGRA